MQGKILLLALLTTTGVWPQQPFLLRKDIIVSQQSGGGATAGPTMVADFNGDGRADIAVCNALSLTILLSTGGGNFRSVVPGIDTCAGVAADINADGRADLVAVNVLRLGQGDGTFLPPRTVRVDGPSPLVVSAGDFNGDRKLDLLFYTGSLGWEEEPLPVTMHMMLGDGEGGFSESWRIVNPPARALGAAIAGDFNRDGNIDLAANSGEGILVFPGQGNGTFRSPVHTVNGEDSNNLVVGDFNRDGNLDLGSAMSIALGKGDGTFQRPIPHGLSTRTEEGIAIGFRV